MPNISSTSYENRYEFYAFHNDFISKRLMRRFKKNDLAEKLRFIFVFLCLVICRNDTFVMTILSTLFKKKVFFCIFITLM